MIIYLHGFSSSAASHKATLLKQALSQYNFFIPEYPSHQPNSSVSYLTEYIKKKTTEYKNEPLMLIGSSLGGYYAQYLSANLDIVTKVVLINPALQAQKTLHPYIGQQTNMVTGETFVFTQQDCDKLQLLDVAIEDISVPTLVLLDEGDELIDYRFAEQKYLFVGRVVVYPVGSHWFDHLEEAMPEIVSFYSI